MPANEGLHVLALSAKNFLGLKVLELPIGPDGVIVSGDNGHGKTSALTILTAALGGAKEEPAVPIRAGSFSATIKVLLGRDGVTKYSIEKTWENGKAVKLTVTASGTPVTSPQKLLDGFVGALSFDVGEFIHPAGAKTAEAVAKAQSEILLQACPLDVNLIELATKRLVAFNDRRDVKRDADRIAAELRTQGNVEVPEAVDATALVAELAAARTAREADVKAKARLEALNESQRETAERIKRIAADLAAAQESALRIDEERAVLLARPVGPDVSVIETKANAAVAQNDRRKEAVAANAAFKKRMGELADTQTKVATLTKAIEACDDERAAALARASFPYPGLSLEEGVGVVLAVGDSKIPFAQLNHALQVQIAFRILAKLSPDLRATIVRDGNALDHKSLAALAAEAHAVDYQLLVERIDATDSLPSVEFRDGAVAEEPSS